MISFWVDAPGGFGIEEYLKGRGQALRERVVLRKYAWQEAVEASAGPQVFAALDQLSPEEREAVAALYDQLARLQPGVALLNDPRRCLLRPALLDRLAELGLNSFRAYPVERARDARFPVFVREIRGHTGNLTPLLHSEAALRRALLALRMRMYPREELLIVEFCDTSDAHGLFRKYSALKVGEALIPWHVIAGRSWMLKSETSVRSVDIAREELFFAEQNPFEAWLHQVFELAGIQYGRIDFGVLDGRPQAWEINLNPTIGAGTGQALEEPAVSAVRNQWRELSHRRLREAFLALEQTAASEPLALRLDPALLERIGRESNRRRGKERLTDRLRALRRAPLIGAVLRGVLRRFSPRN